MIPPDPHILYSLGPLTTCGSGTGGPAKYGIIPQMPLTTLEGVNVLDNRTYWQKRVFDEEKASVGGFKTKLENGVGIELAGARHSGAFSYDFPAGKEKHVLVDVSHYLPGEGSTGGEGQFYSDGAIHLQPDGKVYTGYGSYGGGFSNRCVIFRLHKRTSANGGRTQRTPDNLFLR